MDKSTNKTFTAPDGSVFRIEADGSVTKIKTGNPQPPKLEPKQIVTPAGEIYLINPDGSKKFVGYAKTTPIPPIPGRFPPPVAPRQKESGSALIWIILIISLAVGGLAAYLIYENFDNSTNDNYYDYDYDYGSDYIYEPSEEAIESPTQSYDYEEKEEKAAEAAPAEEYKADSVGSAYYYYDTDDSTDVVYWYDDEYDYD